MVNARLALAIVSLLAINSTSHAQDITAGATVFKKCAACHSVEEGQNKVGPSLHKVIGRTAGTLAGYQYSQAMKAAGAGGLVWDEATIEDYLVAPKDKVKGTKMAFVGLKNPKDIKDLYAYLQSVSQ
ncbi:cytochrome c [Phyllobacterium trifolii]|uniref:Cytochrome c n=1 Tax=Phyllobacterium trifolii TaxID=300193 RepID=A0A839U7X5_9HYPH|nr:cytochrome c family protein [Phyllobacterium trifolii]MBB3147226.1 cytochrome c [Phyllobacterium trifolii]